jgi:hypothetical protein
MRPFALALDIWKEMEIVHIPLDAGSEELLLVTDDIIVVYHVENAGSLETLRHKGSSWLPDFFSLRFLRFFNFLKLHIGL